ncbi:MAG TPA: hypothetical protein VD794_11295 [Flavisolibacter sp.]|nr:hypothetical protein [Flavisolibacter sp.]
MRFALWKTNLCVLLLFIVSLTVNAQTFTDVVHLKNGTIVRGIIIEQVPGKTIKVQTADALKIEINYSDIEKITKETSITTSEASISIGSSTTTVTQQKELKKYFFTTGAGFIAGDVIGYAGRISAGLRLGNHFDLQAFYQLSEADKALTGDARKERYSRFSLQHFGIKASYTITTSTAVQPYFSIGSGYSKSPYTRSGRLHDVAANGAGGDYGYYQSVFVNPAFGIGIPIGKNNIFFTEVNYNWHSWTKVHQVNRSSLSDYPKPYESAQFASLLVGVKF